MNTPERERLILHILSTCKIELEDCFEAGSKYSIHDTDLINIWQAAIATCNEEHEATVAALNSRVELLEHDMKTGDYEALYAIEASNVEELEAVIERLNGAIATMKKLALERTVAMDELQAQVAMKDEAFKELLTSEKCSLGIEETEIIEEAHTASPSNWLKKKLLEARIDECVRNPCGGYRMQELRASLAALEGEK